MKETLQFLGYMKKIKENKTKAERERDRLTESMQSEKTNEYLKNRNYFAQQKDEFYKVKEETTKFSSIDSFVFPVLSRAFTMNAGDKFWIEDGKWLRRRTKEIVRSLKLPKCMLTMRVWRGNCLKRERIAD